MNINPSNVWQGREVKSFERALLAISIICGVSYLLAPFFLAEQIREYWIVNTITKGLAVAPLAVRLLFANVPPACSNYI